MRTKSGQLVILFSLLALLILAPCAAEAQSSFTRSGLNGALFDVHSRLDDAGAPEQFGGQIGFSIGGILDVGAVFSVGMDEIESRDATETSIGIRYGIMLVKQENQAPFSLQLDGDYSFSFVDSGYYDDQDQQKEGHGYVLNLRLLRDFYPGKGWLIRLGAFGGYRSFRYTVSQVGLLPEEEQPYLDERESGFRYGGILSIGKKTSRGRTWYVSGEPVLDEDINVSVSVRTGVIIEM
ncbi:hypothetical protein [Marispirochaeta aestuarii]|uniref:hypothetical protein n=1 Tax=Marispirochaeta aestuarii TaxID=1963862 RepID=UPI0029C7B528|nr:hypothetical protein [Marispirochaeta aestuarii]